jgi:hypothetical protein
MENPLHGRLLFLIGCEASRAMSSSLWNPVLGRLGSTWHYEDWDVPAGSGMAGVGTRLLADDVVAANVTMPHKQWAARTADTVSESVRLSGAANLLIGRASSLTAHNTDITAVAELLGGRPQPHALLLGAGVPHGRRWWRFKAGCPGSPWPTGTRAPQRNWPPSPPAWEWLRRRFRGTKPGRRPGPLHS